MDYLSSLRPAVVHRDVKPENIVLESGKWGGRVFLVDFGGVQVRSVGKCSCAGVYLGICAGAVECWRM